VDGAFSRRKALKVPLLSKFAEPFCDFKYKSAGINDTLLRAFGDGYLFGQTNSGGNVGDRVKVGVVTCIEGRHQPCLIANYSRNPIARLKDGREACTILPTFPWDRRLISGTLTDVHRRRLLTAR